jgi:hypothetical protein
LPPSDVAFLQKVYKRAQLGSDVRAAGVIEKQARERRATRVEHADEAFFCDELAHTSLRDVREPEPVESGPDHEPPIIQKEPPLDGDLESLPSSVNSQRYKVALGDCRYRCSRVR